MAVAASLLAVAVSVAVTVPALAGVNRTATVHDLRGPKLVAVQVSLVTVKAAEPESLTARTPLAPPELVSVNVCELVWPTVTCP